MRVTIRFICIMMAAVALCASGSASAATYSWTGTTSADWHTPGNWNPAEVPTNGATVEIAAGASILLTNETAALTSCTMTGGTLTFSNWTTRLRATDVVLTNDAALTLPPGFSETQMSNRVWIACSNLFLGSEARINAGNRGYQCLNGPGHGTGYGGAGHGGRGSIHDDWPDRGLTYGAVALPVTPGSGGGTGPDRSRSGGGAVRIDATGEVAVHGTVDVNGGNRIKIHGAGGSGGSIYIGCRTFTGSSSGLLSARGGIGENYGGAGGGGRIAVVYDEDAQSAMTPVNPGVRFSAAPGASGRYAALAEPGTLFLPDAQFLSANMTEQWDGVEIVVAGMQQWQVASLNIAGSIGFPEIRRLVVTNDLTIAGGGRLSLHGAVTNTPALEDGMHLDIGGAFSIADGGRLVLTCNPSNGAAPYVTCNSLTVETGGYIDGNYRGFAPPGAGDGNNNGPGGGVGAGHGGYGSMGEYSWSSRGAPYGNPEAPTVPGSGGHSDRSGYGGGAVIIHATEAATVRGTISANGLGAMRLAGSGGSGGAIYLRCRTFHGDAQGYLSARGGSARRSIDGWGAGGRIAVVYDPVEQADLPQPNPGVRFSTAGWADSSGAYIQLAETGTLYLPGMDEIFLSSHMTGQWDDVALHIPGFSTWQTPSLEISGQFGIRGLEALEVAGNLTLAPGGRFALYSGPLDPVYTNVGARMDVGGKLDIQAGATLMLCATSGVGPYVECGSLSLQSNGVIRAYYRGYNPERGPGRGTGNEGGGYGGWGGYAPTSQVYGVAFAPVYPGSGGGTSDRGGRGGGLVRISARRAMQVDGTIAAYGMVNTRANGGAGSGGGVLLTSSRFSGTGAILAQGASRSPGNGGGGGGGRIAVWEPFLRLSFVEEMVDDPLPLSTEIFDPAVRYPELALSVAGGSPSGEDGTVFFGRLRQGTLILLH